MLINMFLYFFLKANEYITVFSFPCSVGDKGSLVQRYMVIKQIERVNFLQRPKAVHKWMVLDGNNKLSSPYSATNKDFYKHKSLPE